MLTAEKCCEVFYEEDSKLFWKSGVSKMKKHGDPAGYRMNTGYIGVSYKNKLYLAHRILWAMRTGKWPELHIDHINGIRDDNRPENLREVTRAQNMRNRRLSSNNTVGIQGVSKIHKKWRVRIKYERKTYWLGLYETLLEAKAARKAAEILLGFHENHGAPRIEYFENN